MGAAYDGAAADLVMWTAGSALPPAIRGAPRRCRSRSTGALAADAGLKRAGLKRRSGSRASLQKRDARGRTALFYAAEADRPENARGDKPERGASRARESSAESPLDIRFWIPQNLKASKAQGQPQSLEASKHPQSLKASASKPQRLKASTP